MGRILEALRLPNDKFGYEMKLREALSEIWLMLFELSRPMLDRGGETNRNNDKIKLMMIYIHEHYPEKISIRDLAAAAYLSERECFRVFHDYLHMTPVEYIKSYRLQKASQMHGKRDRSRLQRSVMPAVWGAAAILERFFGTTRAVRLWNIGENGRIVIYRGRN